jgi:poly(3-hydroxybutyrate) depolymerase
MDSRRLVLVAAGAGLSIAAALPSTLAAERDDEGTATEAAPTEDVAFEPPAPFTGRVETTATYGGRPRAFVLHVPEALTGPAPLVVALHAHSQTPDSIRDYTALESLAEAEGFAVVFPGGAGGSWNAGGCCEPGTTEDSDDVAFLDEVIALTTDRVPIDQSRIGLTGSSNGAMMALRYACERSEVVASVAIVGGPLMAPCDLEDPVAVLALHGENDHVVPVGGGKNPGFGVTFPAVGPSLEPFRRAGGNVTVNVVRGAGHGWMTPETASFDASRAVWEWVRDHPRAD